MTRKQGQAGRIVAPNKPAVALEADLADPGAMERIKAAQIRSRTGKYGAPPVGSRMSSSQAAAAEAAEAAKATRGEMTWIEFVVLHDDTGEPVSDVKLTVRKPDESEMTGETDATGKLRLDDIDPGTCDVRCDFAGATLSDTFNFVGMGPPPSRAQGLEDTQRDADTPGQGSGTPAPIPRVQESGPDSPARQSPGRRRAKLVIRRTDSIWPVKMAEIATGYATLYQALERVSDNQPLLKPTGGWRDLYAGDEIYLPEDWISEFDAVGRLRAKGYQVEEWEETPDPPPGPPPSPPTPPGPPPPPPGPPPKPPPKPSPGSPKWIARIEQHKVTTGETLDGIAREASLSESDLAWFNWKTRSDEEIQDHLRDDVGCTYRTEDDTAYRLHNYDHPGIIYVPRRWEESGLITTQTHHFRVAELRIFYVQLVSERGHPIPEAQYRARFGDGTTWSGSLGRSGIDAIQNPPIGSVYIEYLDPVDIKAKSLAAYLRDAIHRRQALDICAALHRDRAMLPLIHEAYDTYFNDFTGLGLIKDIYASITDPEALKLVEVMLVAGGMPARTRMRFVPSSEAPE